MGLVETGVGLIPAGGGAKCCCDWAAQARLDLIARVSDSAPHARELGFLRRRWNLDESRGLTADAKAAALATVAGWAQALRGRISVEGAPATQR